MALQIGDIAPDLQAESTEGPTGFHTWLEDQWGVFFSHPKDFAPVCTTERGEVARAEYPEGWRAGKPCLRVVRAPES